MLGNSQKIIYRCMLSTDYTEVTETTERKIVSVVSVPSLWSLCSFGYFLNILIVPTQSVGIWVGCFLRVTLECDQKWRLLVREFVRT